VGRAILEGLLDPLDLPPAAEPLPDWLLPHQADAVHRCRAILRRFGGALLADGVGVGKTFVALALADLERRDGGSAVAVVPAALRGEWRQASLHTGITLPIWSHTQLARRTPAMPGASLLLVDEAHAFRNPATRRYAALADLAAGRRVALLSATPYNNSPADLIALIRLFAGNDRFREFGVADLPAALRAPDTGAAGLALAAISVCRSRRLVRARFPELETAFPRRCLAPVTEYDLDGVYGRGLASLLGALGRLADSAADHERGSALFHLALLRRLESSRAALLRSLRRHREFLREWSAASSGGRRISRREFGALFPRHDDDDTQLALLPLLLEPANAPADRGLGRRRAALDRALQIVEGACGGVDPKLAALLALLRGELAGHRAIVFTEYRDTALHLARALRHRFRVLAVTGSSAWAGGERLSRRRALDAFAPVSRGARADPLLAADVLIATDVASEGMNLQDASAVVNYDLPWNPVRIMQRIGRVDRLGAVHAEAVVAHLQPAGGLRELTGVLRALRAKLDAGPHALGIEPDPLEALWWVGRPQPLPVALEAESWRRVEPFEAAERWRAIVGPRTPSPRGPPCVAAGVAPGLDEPAAGLLLALEWPGGARIPLAYTVSPSGQIRAGAVDLGELAVRALTAQPLPASAGDFSCVLASILPHARAQLLAMSAARHGADGPAAGRRAALHELLLTAHGAAEARDADASARIEPALAALAHDLPAGLERRLARLLRAGVRDRDLAERVLQRVAPALGPPGPALEGTPHLVLVGAVVLAGTCPSAQQNADDRFPG
jgi:hypothetical protein